MTVDSTSLFAFQAGKRHARRGMTLLEVIVSMAIFLIALGAILPLIQMGQSRAVEIELQAVALQKCQSKIAEVMAGGEAMSTQTDATFPESTDGDDWRWSMDVGQDDSGVANLWTVTVHVY